MSINKGVMAYCDFSNGKLTALSTEGLGIGRKLADELGQELSAVILGSNTGDISQEAIRFGANKVYVVDSPLLKEYQSDIFFAALEKVTKQVMPLIIILGQNYVGRDLGPRLAFRLGTALITDCLDLSIDPQSKRLIQTKPIYGGNARAIFTTDTDPQIVTIRTKAMTPLIADTSRTGEVINLDASLDSLKIKVKKIDTVLEKSEGIKLEDAPVVVSGGRGLGGPEGFKQLEVLAKLLKGTIGSSRPACDNGWVSTKLQVGLTGKIIAPEVYVAVGISGSNEHLAGCSGSKNIIAINKDPEANIFSEARFGIVGDWKRVIPAFTEKIRELTEEKG